MEVNIEHVWICATCTELYDTQPHGEAGYMQKCACDPNRNKKPWEEHYEISEEEQEKLGRPYGIATFDFNEWITLCRCCAREPLRSGSKWAAFFCRDCNRRVISLNERYSQMVIPIGRHSLMNQFGPTRQIQNGDELVEGILDFIKAAGEAQAVLAEWRRSRVGSLIEAVGFDSGRDVPLPEYLDRLSELPGGEWNKAAAFEGLVSHKEGEGIQLRG